jgi:hypothetical protein
LDGLRGAVIGSRCTGKVGDFVVTLLSANNSMLSNRSRNGVQLELAINELLATK